MPHPQLPSLIRLSRKAGTATAIALACLLSGPASASPDNRAIIRDFARLFYTEKNVERAFRVHVAPKYIQHNPGIADGREAAIQALRPLFSPQSPQRFKIEHILVDGDLAAIHVLAIDGRNGAHTAVVDLYRLSKGHIVEHWDVLQPVPAHSKNAHPMF